MMHTRQHVSSLIGRSLALIFVGHASVVTPAAQQPGPAEWSDLATRLERAATVDSAADLRVLRGDLLRILTQPAGKEREALVQLGIAYVASRMAFAQGVPDKERDDLLDDAVQRLQAIVKKDPRNAEAHILLGGVYGSQIARSAIQGMILGPRASGALDRAAELAPENPRVPLQQGISAINTPAMFGGGIDKAERLLRRSLDLFAREPANRSWPNWGRFEVHAWLGQTLLRKGDRAGARSEYDKAFAIAPSSGWIRYVLLPALER